MKAGIICAQGLEECEALMTYDLLYRAGIETLLIGTEKEITSSHNVTFRTHILIEDFNAEDFDCIILPGGMPGTKNLEADERVQKIINDFVKEDKYVAAICAAPSILDHKGLLREGKFVCYPGFEGDKKTASGKACADGRFITGKGVGATFEFAYKIIEALAGKEKADETLARTQY